MSLQDNSYLKTIELEFSKIDSKWWFRLTKLRRVSSNLFPKCDVLIESVKWLNRWRYYFVEYLIYFKVDLFVWH